MDKTRTDRIITGRKEIKVKSLKKERKRKVEERGGQDFFGFFFCKQK